MTQGSLALGDTQCCLGRVGGALGGRVGWPSGKRQWVPVLNPALDSFRNVIFDITPGDEAEGFSKRQVPRCGHGTISAPLSGEGDIPMSPPDTLSLGFLGRQPEDGRLAWLPWALDGINFVPYPVHTVCS